MLITSVDAKTAVRICGFRSVAMLDYLQRSGVFIPTRRAGRRGKGRRYEFRELLVLKTISTLLENGASVHSLKTALNEFQKKKWTADQATLEGEGGPLKYLVASGRGVLFAKSCDNLFDMTKNGQMAFSFVVDLDKLHSDLCFQIQQQDFSFVGGHG